jgi:hypothetical protein
VPRTLQILLVMNDEPLQAKMLLNSAGLPFCSTNDIRRRGTRAQLLERTAPKFFKYRASPKIIFGNVCSHGTVL